MPVLTRPWRSFLKFRALCKSAWRDLIWQWMVEKRGELILSGHEDNQFYQLKRLRDNRTLILSPDKLLHRLV